MSDPPTLPVLAHMLDHVLNKPPKQRRREGFILLRFSHERISRPQYVSTCGRHDTIRLLKLVIAELEGRVERTAGHA
jgi:hypothetical protein